MSNILDSGKKEEYVSDDLISFKDCPNKCIDGRIFDPYTHKKTICKYCADKRLKFAKGDLTDSTSGKTISELLNLPTSYTGNEYNEELVIPNFARKELKSETVDLVLAKMRELMTNMSIGKLPDYSIMFNLGKKANEANFVYPYLIKGYISGRSLVPLVSLPDLCQLRLQYEGSPFCIEFKKDYTYNDLIERDVCVIVIDAGATITSLLAVKGLMQLRSQKLKSTILFTNSWNRYVRDLCSEDNYKCYNLATLYSVDYGKTQEDGVSSDETYSTGSQMSPTAQNNGYGMTSDAFRNLMTPKNTL